jgi:hypothetical protein
MENYYNNMPRGSNHVYPQCTSNGIKFVQHGVKDGDHRTYYHVADSIRVVSNPNPQHPGQGGRPNKW